jgi:hypothetical protein
VFPVLLEPGDPPVEFGSLSLGHRNVLVVEALPKGLVQIVPLAWREPGQLGYYITHAVPQGERKNDPSTCLRTSRSGDGKRTRWPIHGD